MQSPSPELGKPGHFVSQKPRVSKGESRALAILTTLPPRVAAYGGVIGEQAYQTGLSFHTAH